jgi:cobalamin biosynthesis protein CbiD
MVSVGKLRKLWDSVIELHSSVCERRLDKTVLRLALLPVKTAQITQFFGSGLTSHSKIAQFN